MAAPVAPNECRPENIEPDPMATNVVMIPNCYCYCGLSAHQPGITTQWTNCTSIVGHNWYSKICSCCICWLFDSKCWAGSHSTAVDHILHRSSHGTPTAVITAIAVPVASAASATIIIGSSIIVCLLAIVLMGGLLQWYFWFVVCALLNYSCEKCIVSWVSKLVWAFLIITYARWH